MVKELTDSILERAKELAGPQFQEMLQSKECALTMLSSPDCDLSEAAILVCEAFWKCGRDSRVVEACRSIINSDAEEPKRIAAIASLSMGHLS